MDQSRSKMVVAVVGGAMVWSSVVMMVVGEVDGRCAHHCKGFVQRGSGEGKKVVEGEMVIEVARGAIAVVIAGTMMAMVMDGVFDGDNDEDEGICAN